MINYIKGNLLSSEAQALVNTVNTVGVMGKGIALQFKNRYPDNYKIYREACKHGSFKTGQVLVVHDGDLMNRKIIVNFPTKEHWKVASKYEYITSGLKALKVAIKENHIESIAIPPLGCGNGGLDWTRVKDLIEEALLDVDIQVFVYTPTDEIKAILQKETPTQEVKLTPARAMLLYLLFQYESMGEPCSLFVANKLAYFMQRRGENLRLKFEAHHYGPYAVQLNHVLLHLNGVYLNGMEQNEVKPFEPLHLNYSKRSEINEYIDKKLSYEQKERMNDVMNLTKRFESTFSLELLATVDYIISTENTNDLSKIMEKVSKWNRRKNNLFQPAYVEIAYKHLMNYAENPFAMANE